MDNETNEMLEEIVAKHGYAAIKDWRKHWPANYNVAPTQQVPVATERDGIRVIEAVRWDMVPPRSPVWPAKQRPIINARIETVATNGMFKGPFRQHRVVVSALGYYEWQQREDGKQPFFIRLRDREPLALAGIVSEWHDPALKRDDPDGVRLSMSIITLDAHVTPGEVHDREPAFLLPDAVDDWLGDHLGSDELIDLLRHSSEGVADALEYYEVSRAVNASAIKGEPNSRPEFIQPIS